MFLSLICQGHVHYLFSLGDSGPPRNTFGLHAELALPSVLWKAGLNSGSASAAALLLSLSSTISSLTPKIKTGRLFTGKLCDCVMHIFLGRFVKKLEHSWKALVHDGVSSCQLGVPPCLPDF